MKITYIFHSGFLIETNTCLLIFDYWVDYHDAISKVLANDKPLYVFCSHFHEDHLNRQIFQWKEKKSNITYILSKDILKHRRANQNEANIWLAKGGSWEDDHIKVWATGSNDSGVSWIVEIEGKRVFHAGDLNNWYARFLAEEPIPETIFSEEFGEIHPIAEEKQYLGELKDIRKITDHFDVVMFPVDGRIGNGYTLGARQFIERFSIGLFIPMHFVASGFESAWRMEPYCEEKTIPFWSIQTECDTISLIEDMYIRKSNLADSPRLQEIFAIARKFMVSTGNPNQWAEDYPSEELLNRDIMSGDNYVCVKGNKIVATFLLRGGFDPTYNKIYEGTWLNDLPYATIHRIASSGEIKGIFDIAMSFALQKYNSIRIDTHRDNHVMRHVVKKAGFKYCGIIHCWNGSERLAYQYYT